MQVFHTTRNDATAKNAAIERLHKAVAELRARRGAEENFKGFEQELHAVFMDAECEILAEELERLDVNQPQLLIDGHLHHRVLRSSETYLSAAGAVKVWRTAVPPWSRWGGGAVGVACGYGGRSVHPARGAPSAVGGGASDPAGGRRVVSGSGQHEPFEEQSGSVAEAVLGAVGRATGTLRGAVARSDEDSRSGGHGGGVARWGDDADEGRGARCQARPGCCRGQAHERTGRLSRSGLCDAELSRCRRRAAGHGAHGADAGVKESDREDDASGGGGGRTPTTPAVAGGQACRRGQGQLDLPQR